MSIMRIEKVAKNQNDALNSLASNNNLSRMVDAGWSVHGGISKIWRSNGR